MRSSESPRSMIVNAGSSSIETPCRRSSRVPIAWNVPPHTASPPGIRTPSPRSRRRIPSTRRVISCAARRVKVSSRMRRGSTPLAMWKATRFASVVVLPVPAPATISSGVSPCVTAACWAPFRSASTSPIDSAACSAVCMMAPIAGVDANTRSIMGEQTFACKKGDVPAYATERVPSGIHVAVVLVAPHPVGAGLRVVHDSVPGVVPMAARVPTHGAVAAADLAADRALAQVDPGGALLDALRAHVARFGQLGHHFGGVLTGIA